MLPCDSTSPHFTNVGYVRRSEPSFRYHHLIYTFRSTSRVGVQIDNMETSKLNVYIRVTKIIRFRLQVIL